MKVAPELAQLMIFHSLEELCAPPIDALPALIYLVCKGLMATTGTAWARAEGTPSQLRRADVVMNIPLSGNRKMKVTFNELFARQNISVFKAFRRASAHCNGSVGTAKEKPSCRTAVYFASHADVQRWLIKNRRVRNYLGRAPVVMPTAARAAGH